MRGATTFLQLIQNRLTISIHTPHAGSDNKFCFPVLCLIIFQSTLPMRGATRLGRNVLFISNISIHTPHAGSDDEISADDLYHGISIHTPHAGSDETCGGCSADLQHFNPHSPCGERRAITRIKMPCCNFNPHSPCGERRKSRLSDYIKH